MVAFVGLDLAATVAGEDRDPAGAEPVAGHDAAFAVVEILRGLACLRNKPETKGKAVRSVCGRSALR